MENLDNNTPAQELGTSQSPNPRIPRPIRIHSHSYEAQLTSEELEKLHAALLKTGVNVSQLLAKCPPWRAGPLAGRKPRLSTIYKILARLRGEQAVAESSSTAQVLGKAGVDCRATSLDRMKVSDLLCRISAAMGAEVLEKSLLRVDLKTRTSAFRALLKFQANLVELAKYKWRVAENVEHWYHHGGGKAFFIENKRLHNAKLINELGKALWGENWRNEGLPGQEEANQQSSDSAAPDDSQEPAHSSEPNTSYDPVI